VEFPYGTWWMCAARVCARDQLSLRRSGGFWRRWTAVLRWFVATEHRSSAGSEREIALEVRNSVRSVFCATSARDGYYEILRD